MSAAPDFAPNPVIAVSAGLIFRAGTVLIAQRHAHSHLGGLWEFPGGKHEPGETAAAALRRELCEELGVAVVVGELFATLTHAYPERTVRLEFFLCTLPHGEPQPLDCAAVKWVDRAGLREHQFPAADAELLAQLHAREDLWH